MVPTTLVTGRNAGDREAAIAHRLARIVAESPGADTAVILEGLADPNAALASPPTPHVHIVRIAPGCLCCAGNLVLRVTLNRLLRRPPAQLFVSLADATHVGQLRASLSAPPYDTLLSLCDDVAAPSIAS